MGTRGFIAISAKKPTNNGEKNKYQIEGIPALLHQLRFEYMGSERDQCGNYNEDKHTGSYKEEYKKSAGTEEERV